VRRYLLGLAVIALAFAAACLFAVAQAPSAPASADRPGGYAQPQSSLAGIRSDKAVSIVANGISPRALAVDAAGNIYLTDAAVPARIFTLTGLATLTAGAAPLQSARLAPIAGDGTTGSLGDGGNGLAAEFNLTIDSLYMRSGVAVAPDGTIFVADTLNSTIRRIAGSDSPEPGIARSIAGRWAAPQSVKIVEPLGLALDRSNNLYLADRAAGAIDLLPNAVASAPGEQEVQILAHVADPAALAITSDGRKLFVASAGTGAVFQVDTQTRQIEPVSAFPAAKTAGQNGSTTVCGANPSQPVETLPVCPAGIAVDGAGDLFVADTNSGKILRVDAKTSALTTAASGLRSPGAITFDNNANLYVAEQGANRIVKFASMGVDPANLTLTAPAALPAPPAPRVCPQTAPFNFCDQPLGGSTPTQAFTLTNNTSAAVTGLTISLTGSNTGDFQAASNTCGTSLNAGASCVINVDFAPTAAGARSATLTATDSAGDSTTSTVSGTGDDFQLSLNGSQQQEQAVIQGGTLTYNFNIVPDAVFGGVVTITCPSNLPPLTTCTPSASTVTVTPDTPASFSITFKTTYNGVTGGFPGNGAVPLFLTPRGRTGPPAPLALGSLLLLLAAILIFRAARHRKDPSIARFAPARAMWIFAFLLATSGLLFLGGCKHHSVPADLNTPPGSTTMTIQGSAQNAGRGVTIILDVTARG
jgi:sugar lactone lactonase YvrE